MNEHTTTCGISHPFGQLFPTSGQVTYALLSRPPLTTQSKPRSSVRLACLMHAASVYPEPGSNSPKRCTTLRSRLLSEGLTTRTSLSRISCHSSVVKVQRPRRDGPRRRRRMMGLGGPVSNRRPRPGVRTVRAPRGGGTTRMVGSPRGCQTPTVRSTAQIESWSPRAG